MRSLSQRLRRAARGFTMVEMVIGTTIMFLVMGAIGIVVLSGKSNFRQGISAAMLDTRAVRLMERIVSELQWAGIDTLAVEPTAPLGRSDLEFRVCTGVAAAATTWSGRVRIRLDPEPEDPTDGIDNDGDGLTDECQVVLTRDLGTADQVDVVLGRGVQRWLEGEINNGADDNANGLTDEAGLSFVLVEDTLTVRLSVAALNPDGLGQTRTVQTAVTMRN